MHKPRPTVEAVWTVLDIVRWATDYFRERGVDSPRLTIELMLCAVLDVGRLRLYTDFERPLSKDELARLRGMIQRRIRHEPLQYILGSADFYGLTFQVTPDVLIPRPETEHLVDHVVRFGKGRGPLRCLDLCTGTGCIAITAAVHLTESTWLAVDRSEPAVMLARENAERHTVADRVDVVLGDALGDVPEGPFDVVTMNPPYIPADEVADLEANVRDYEPHIALTDDADGLVFYRRFAEYLRDGLVAPNGMALVEVMAGKDVVVTELLRAHGGTTRVIDDLAGIGRIVLWTS